jgi:hypothetical protein
MKTDLRSSLVKVLLAGLGAALLSGCSASFAPSPVQAIKTPIGNIQGTVHGGQYPLSGAHIYLYAAGTGGYGTSATSLLCDAGSACGTNALEDGNGNWYVSTDANGNFALGGEYTCTAGTQVYIISTGGNPGLSGNVNNTAIVQIAAMAECPAAGNLAAQVPYVVINEVTTVAFAYAMSGFATTPYNVSSNAANSAASATAIANALKNANNIVNLQYGQAPAVALGNSNSINPQAKLYALANILATCVNTSDPGQTPCKNLFAAATDSSGNHATDEGNAIFNIVHNQGQNVSAIWALNPSTPVFSPTLSKQPADWTMPVVYSGVVSSFGTNGNNQVISGAYNIAFDAGGNAWIGDRKRGVVEMTPQGAVTAYNPGFTMVKGIAISPDSSQIWVADYSGGTNGKLDIMNTGGAITASSTTDMDGPSAVAFDANGNGFVVNELNGSIVGFSSAGAYVDYSGAVGVTTPAWISLDGNDNAWLPSTSGNGTQVIGRVPLNYDGNSGKFKNFGTIATIAADFSYGLAVDSNNNAWFATNDISNQGAPSGENLEDVVRTVTNKNNGNQKVSYGLSGTSHSGSGYNGGGLGIPYKISVDGGNNVWMANEYYQTVSEWSQTLNKWLGVPGTQGTGFFGTGEVDATGYNNASSGTTLSATPDPSGNVWTANTDGTVTQLLGLATPTASPIYPGVFGTKP